MKKNITLLDKPLLKVFENLLAVTILLSANSIYWVAVNRSINRFIFLFLIFIVVILAFLCLFELPKDKDSKKLITILSVNLIVNFSIVLYNKIFDNIGMADAVGMTIFPLGLIIYFYYYLINKKKPNIFYLLERYIFILASMSLFFYFFFYLGLIHQNSNILISWGNMQWVPGIFNIHFFPQGTTKFFGIDILRNTGIYAEAPMFSFVLCIGLIIYYFIENNENFFTLRSIVLITALITSTSTTGVIILIGIFILRFYIQKMGHHKLFLFTITPVIAVVTFVIVRFVLERKFNDMAGSTSIRLNDFFAGYQAFIQKPFLGHGMISGGNIIKSYMEFSRLGLYGNDGYSNGLFYGLARIGVIGMTSCIFLPSIIASTKNLNIAAISLLTFVLLMMTVIFGSYLYSFFIAFFFTISFFSKKDLDNFIYWK